MSAPVISRSLCVSVDLVRRTARVVLPSVANDEPFVVTVVPIATGGWEILDPSDVEPTWRATFDAAIGEALAQATSMLEELLGREVAGAEATESSSSGRPLVDIC